MLSPIVLTNYRNQFQTKFGSDPVMTDNELEEIITAIGVLPSAKETDEAVLEDMRSASIRNTESIRTATISYRD